jgi:hypothetical protein
MIKRLPIIRHVRWLILSWKVERYYAMWQQYGMLPVHRHRDDRVGAVETGAEYVQKGVGELYRRLDQAGRRHRDETVGQVLAEQRDKLRAEFKAELEREVAALRPAGPGSTPSAASSGSRRCRARRPR